jgi:glycosyltransferase involved in cell wall biosynthesis
MGMSAAPGHDRAADVRVLMVVRLFHPWIGGTERQAHKLAAALIDRGVDTTVVTGRWFRGTSRDEVLDGLPVHRHQTLWEFFGIRGLRKFGGYLYIVTLLWYLWRRRAHYDVIHVHGLNYHTFAAVIAGRRLRKPVIAKLANSGPASDITKMREDRQLALAHLMLPTALACDRFVAVNPTVAAELCATGVPPDRIIELTNGVDATRPARSRYELHDPPCVTYVGRLHAQKSLDTLLEAFAILRPRLAHGVVLRLVGEGPAEDSLRALAADLRITGVVDFAGRHQDVTTQLDLADVFVLPSRVEGMSNALLEAMTAGLPSVVSDIPGNRAVITDGSSGLVVPVDDPSSLATALERLLTDRHLRARLGSAARVATEQTYALDRVATQYLELYASVRREARARAAMGGPGT